MKKNIKLGLMAGLLITPAIVAQAGEVQASETPTPLNGVAALTAEDLLNSFKAANEEFGAPKIALERTKFNTMSDEEKSLLTQAEINFIDAKISYLESFIKFKTDVVDLKTAINKLGPTNKNLVAETKAAQAVYDELLNEITNASTTLSSVANQAGDRSVNLLDTLNYYGGDGPVEFIKKSVTELSIKKLEDNNDLVVEIEDFITDAITPIQAASQVEPIVKEAYVKAVEEARTNFTNLDLANKNVIKIQIVENNVGIEQYLKNAEANITKVKAVEDKIKDIEQNPPTGTLLNSKITTILKDYDNLDRLQKALVSNFDQMESYENAVKVVNEITALTRLTANSEELRNTLPNIEKSLEDLNTVEIDFVSNANKLAEIRAAVDKALLVETQISAINTADAKVMVPAARKAYNDIPSAERKYVLKEALDLLTSWEKSSSTAANVTKQIEAIKTDVFANFGDDKLVASRKLSTATSFVTKVRTAESSYAKIKDNEREKELVPKRARLEALIPIAKIADHVLKLNVTSTTYLEDLELARTEFDLWDTFAIALEVSDQADIKKLHDFLSTHLQELENEQQLAANLDKELLALQNGSAVDLQKNTELRGSYNALSANGKRLVKNIKVLTDLERQYKPALTAIQAIDAIKLDAKDFARKTIAAEKAFDKLAQPMKDIVYNKPKLDELIPYANLMNEIDGIRPTAKDFRAKLLTVQQTYDGLMEGFIAPTDPATDLEIIKTRLLTDHGKKLAEYQGVISSASTLENQIDALKTKSGEAFIAELMKVSEAYKGLKSPYKNNVSNANLLKEFERDYRASLRVIDLINKLPENTDRSFASKVTAAQKAYERLTDKQKNDVFNYNSKLKNILKVANLIDRIDKIRVGSKTYEADVAAIRSEFTALTSAEQQLVHNISKLTTAEEGVSNAKDVIALIDAAIPTADNYIGKIVAARNGYDSLSSADRRLVTNYKDLQSRERAVKPVLKLDADILALNTSNARTFISKYKAVEKAYEKLSMSERALLLNAEKFLGEITSIYNVIDAINSIKPSSKTFVAETQAARALYNSLPANLASQVSNVSTLQEHELNVDGGAKVDAMIRALNSAPAKEFVDKVKEAREAYKSLSTANRKAVTLESELKEQERYIKPIEAAIKAIDGLSNPRNDLSRQFTTVNNALKQLDSKQKEYVTNMDQYSNLSNVIHVYTLIAGLKPNDKYYQGNIEAAKLAYDRLSEDEKLKVTNYYKLQQALLDITEVQKVTTIIASINPSSSNFEVDVQNALAAYKALPSASKRQVLNYSALQQAERDLKAAQRVIKQIDELDSTLRLYASKAKSAKTAYERLTNDQKSLVKNYNKLQAAIFELGL